MQRVRLALPYLRGLGWEPVVMAIHPNSVEGGVSDPLLEKTYPADIRIIRVHGVPSRLTRWAGIGSLWLRCGRALRLAGEELLRAEAFDLVFFSTTQFGSFNLGPRWKRKFGVPYVLDYQDPWVNDHYTRTGEPPPGGAFKYGLTQAIARRREPLAVANAAGIMVVSPAYERDLTARYPALNAQRVQVTPFGSSLNDIELARSHVPANPLIDFGDGCCHLVYTGRGGADMAVALTLIFRAFKVFKKTQPAEAARLRFHFIGTSYAPPPLGKETIMPVARAEGVAEYVYEHCRRVPYFEALHYLARADAVLAIGSHDPGYSASKIFPCLLARKPLLAVFHQDSPIHGFMRQAGLASYDFGPDGATSKQVEQIAVQWFSIERGNRPPVFNAEAFKSFTAPSMTVAMATCFDAAMNAS